MLAFDVNKVIKQNPKLEIINISLLPFIKYKIL